MQIQSPRLAARLKGITWAPQSDPVAELLAHLEVRELSPRSIKNYRTDLAQLAQHLGTTPMLEATAADLRAWQAWQHRRGVKASTIRRKMSCVRGFYAWAVKVGHLDRDPSVNLDAPRVPERLPRHLTDAQTEALLAALKTDTALDRRETAIVKCLYYTGIRAGELVGLDVDRWDREANTLRVIGKGNRERRVPVPPQLAEVLTRHMKEHPTGAGPLFRHWEGGRESYDNILRAVKRAGRRAGIGKVTPHQLRHTFATRLVNRGVPINVIQKLLGHKQISTTTIYANTHLPADIAVQLGGIL